VEAVRVYRKDPDAIGLVLLDVQMPGLDGPQTLSCLRQLNPDVNCIFMTGDLGRYAEEDLLGRGAAKVLHKPFRLLEAAQVIWRLIDEPVRHPWSSVRSSYIPPPAPAKLA
jgi:CheY-like chemotaxis protein